MPNNKDKNKNKEAKIVEENNESEEVKVEIVEGIDVEELVKCMFLINVKYGTEIKAIGEFLKLNKDEAKSLEINGIVKVVN